MNDAANRSNSYNLPDSKGRFGEFGGLYVPETLMPLVLELTEAWREAKQDPEFWREYRSLMTYYVGRPSPPGIAASFGGLASNIR